MEKFITEVKYSLLGNYNDLKSSPNVVSKLNDLFRDNDLIPNNLIVNDLTKAGLEKIYRPQFINIKENYNIDFLPDRIDFVFKKSLENFEIDSFDKKVIKLISILESYGNLKSSRFAFTVAGAFEGSNDFDINQDTYLNNEKIFEYQLRTAHRKNIKINEKDYSVNINISRFVNHDTIIKVNSSNFKGTRFSFDINTYPLEKGKNFNLNEYSEFIRGIQIYLTQSFDALEVKEKK